MPSPNVNLENAQPDSDVARLERWYESCSRTSYIRRAGWFVNIAFYLAYQYLVADTHEGATEIIEVIEDDGKVRLTLNEILPYVEHMIAKYVSARPKIQAIPKLGDDQDASKNREGAKHTEALLDFLEEKQELQILDQSFLWWLLLSGTGIEKVYWDEEEGRKIREPVEETVPLADPMTGAPIPGEYRKQQARHADTGDLLFHEYQEGEVTISIVSTFRFVIDPDQTIRTAPRVCEIQPCTKEQIEEEFGEAVAATLPEGGDLAHWAIWEKRMLSLENPNTRWQEWSVDENRKLYLKKEFWERPSKEHPKGLHLMTVGGKLVGAKGELPMKKDGSDFLFGKRMFPYLSMQDVLRPFRFHGGAVVDHLVPLQKLFNTEFSRIVEHERKFPGKWTAAIDSVESEEQFNDIEGEVILWDPAGGTNPPPQIQSRPPLPEYITQLLDRIEAKFEDVGGRHDTSQGRIDRGVKSGKQAAFLVEKDDTRLGAKFRRWAQFLVERAKMMVAVAQANYEDSRQIVRKFDQHGRFNPAAISVMGKDLEDNLTFIEGTELPMSQADREQRARQHWQDGVYGDPRSERAAVAYMKEAGAGNINETFETFWLVINKAQKENEGFLSGLPVPPPSPWELHAIELDEHRNFWMSEKAQMLSPEGVQALEQHIFLTMQAMNPQPAPMPGAPLGGPMPRGGPMPPMPQPGQPQGLPGPMPGPGPGAEFPMPEPSEANELAPLVGAIP